MAIIDSSAPLHERLRRFRKSNRLTQQQVADALEIERSTYTYYESGRSKPGIKTLGRLCRLYGVSYDMLLENEDPVCAVGDTVIDRQLDAEDFFIKLSAQEKSLVLRFRMLSEAQRAELLSGLGVSEDLIRPKAKRGRKPTKKDND